MLTETFVVFAVAFLFSLWSSGWLLRSYFFMVDDARETLIFGEADARWKADGIRGAWQALMPPDENNIGPWFRIRTYLVHLVSPAESNFLFHFFRILASTIFISAMWGAARRLGSGVFGAVVTLLLANFLCTPGLLADMQTYAANWWRLQTTDGAGAMPLALFWFFTILALDLRGRRAAAALAAAAVALLLTIASKMTFIYLLPGFFCMGLMALHLGAINGRGWRLALVLLLGAIVCLPVFPLYGIGAGGVKIKRYESTGIADVGQLLRGLQFYGGMLLQSGNLLVPVALLAAAASYPILVWQRARMPRRVAVRRVVALGLVISGLGGLVLQSLWPLLLPRYAMVFAPTLALGVGWYAGRCRTYLRRGALRLSVSVRRGATSAGAILWLLGTAALYWPAASGFPKLALSLALTAALPGVLLLLTGFRPFARYSSAALEGMLVALLSFQAVVCAIAFVEARASFRVIQRGGDLPRQQLMELRPPAGEVLLHSNYGRDENIWSVRQFLGLFHGWNLSGGGLGPAEQIGSPAIVHNTVYPHPASSLYLPPGQGAWRYGATVADTTQNKVAGLRTLLEPGSAPIEYGIEPRADFLAGRLFVRLVTIAMPTRMDLIVELVDSATDEVIGASTFLGTESPRQATDRVALEFDPPVALKAGQRYTLRFRTRPGARAGGLLDFFQTGLKGPTFIVYADPSGHTPIGFTLQAAEPWRPGDTPSWQDRRAYSETLLHMDSPWDVIVEILRRKDGLNIDLLRWHTLEIRSSMAAWGVEPIHGKKTD